MKFEDYVREVSGVGRTDRAKGMDCSDTARPELSGLAKCNNLDGAFKFLTSLGFAIGDMDIVSQDEFTLDVILPFPGEKLFLILGVT